MTVFVLAGCAGEGPGARTPTRASGPASELLASPASGATASALTPPLGLTLAFVTRVVDGDTIEVSVRGEQWKLRYIGIDTPETVDPRRPVGCYGKEASERNRQLVEGKSVGLEKDVRDTDDFGRLLRYVWLDGRMVNAALVEEGYAAAATYPPDVRYASAFASLQAKARAAGLGLWGPACQTMAPSPAAPGVRDFSGTSQRVVKGNNNASGERIYHVPGGASYDQTAIDQSKGEQGFCTEAELAAAGWRKSSR